MGSLRTREPSVLTHELQSMLGWRSRMVAQEGHTGPGLISIENSRERDLKLLPEEHTHVNSWPGPCSVPAKQEVAEEEVMTCECPTRDAQPRLAPCRSIHTPGTSTIVMAPSIRHSPPHRPPATHSKHIPSCPFLPGVS